jgi:hypothetical protein
VTKIPPTERWIVRGGWAKKAGSVQQKIFPPTDRNISPRWGFEKTQRASGATEMPLLGSNRDFMKITL